MKLIPEQIDVIVEWLNQWNVIKDTAIPLRFKEDFLDENYKRLKQLREKELYELTTQLIQNKSICPFCGSRYNSKYYMGGYFRICPNECIKNATQEEIKAIKEKYNINEF
jgi:hypothetical protein